MATKKRPSPSDTSASTPSSFVPEARGKAAALSSYLAQGGARVRRGGKYAQGPMKNKTLEQATQDFERLWVKAPDALKEKYASRSQKTDLAPSERGERKVTNATLNEARPGETYDQMQARFRNSRTGKTTPAPAKPPMQAAPVTPRGEEPEQNSTQQNAGKVSATPPPIAGPAEAPAPRSVNQRDVNERRAAGEPTVPAVNTDFNDLTKAPVVPAGDVKSVGDGSFPENNTPPTADPITGSKPPSSDATPQQGQATPPPIPGPASQPPAKPADKTTPVGRGVNAIADSIGSAFLKTVNAVKAPFISDVEAAKADKSLNDAVAAKDVRLKTESDARAQGVSSVMGGPVTPAAPAASPQQQAAASTAADLKAEESRKFASEAGAAAIAARANNTPEQNQQEMDAAAKTSQGLPSAKQEDEQRIMDAKAKNPDARNPMAQNSPDPKNTPVAGPKAAADAKIGEAPPGMVLIGTGWKRDAAGNKTNEREAKYGTMDDSYGKAKIIPGNSAGDIKQTMDKTPVKGDPTKPVMTGSSQTMEQRVADYQSRSNTPQSRDAAGATLESMGVNANASGRTAPPIAGPRGPASQIQPKGPDHNAIQLAAGRSREAAERQGMAYQEAQAKKPTMDDVNRRFTPGTEEHRAAAYGVNPTTGAQLTKEDTKVDVRPAGRNDTMKPGTSRVVASRPATPEELRTGNAGAPPPTIRRPQLVRR